MGFLRGFASFIVLVGLWLVITLTGLVFVFNHTVNPATIKSVLSSGNGYQMVSDSVKKIITDSSPDLDPSIANSVTEQLSGPFIKSKSEEAIDKYFSWFRGDKVDMKISLDELNQSATLLQSLELPNSPGIINGGKLVKDIELPTPTSLKRIEFFYYLSTINFSYYLALIALLAGLLLALRSTWPSRLIWLFHGVFWPALSAGVSLILIYVLKKVINENNSLLKDIPVEYKNFLFTRYRDLLGTIFNNGLVVAVIFAIAAVMLLIIYIIVKHFPSDAKPAEVKADQPPPSSQPTSQTQPIQPKVTENPSAADKKKPAAKAKDAPPTKPTFY